MKVLYFSLFCVVLACCTPAHADSIVSGWVSLEPLNGSPCSSSGSSSSALSLSCSSPHEYARLTGSASPTSVGASIDLETGESCCTGGRADGSFTLTMDGLYELTGGTGYGYANWVMTTYNSMAGPGYFGPCSVTFGGVTQICGSGIFPPGERETGSFYVPYNTPLQFDFTGSFVIASASAMGADGQLQFELTNLTPVSSPVPEPSGLWLLGLASIPAIMIKFRRTRTYNPTHALCA